MKAGRIALLLIPLICLCVGALILYRAPQESAILPEQLQDAAPGESAQDTHALFPAMDPSRVTAVAIRTPVSSFDLRRDNQKTVSINGQRGDKEVFATLLDQIENIDYQPTSAFPSQEETPLLTLLVVQGDMQFAVSFYDDNNTGEYARVVAQSAGESHYGLTSGWRVGTLLLACEGMRIQDAAGKETPAD